MPKSGKTTTACNLALGLGRQGGLRTILFDLDLQNPSVGDFLGYTPEAHIADMLSGKISFADQAVRIGENVAISMATCRETDPTRVLLSEQTRETLHSVQARYNPDIMIFDTPSILVGDNTRAFLKNVDCALIVARANSTKYSHFDDCEREIAEYTNVIGVVLNAFRTKKFEDSLE
jgi:MinD-like ATPase involved in chromosome partitioning or flagellar assembly